MFWSWTIRVIQPECPARPAAQAAPMDDACSHPVAPVFTTVPYRVGGTIGR